MNKEKYIDTILLENDRLYKENNQLKEQKKELKSWLEEEINNIETLFGGETSMTIGYKTVLSKLNELEGGKNDSKRDV